MKERLLLEALTKLVNAMQDVRLSRRLTESDRKFLSKFVLGEDGRLKQVVLGIRKCNSDECNCERGIHFFPYEKDVVLSITQKDQNKLFAMAYKI
jgi:hypothetical protein